MLQKIKDAEGFRKDPYTGAILSVDKKSLSLYRKKREARRNLIEDINSLRNEIHGIKESINAILIAIKDKG